MNLTLPRAVLLALATVVAWPDAHGRAQAPEPTRNASPRTTMGVLAPLGRLDASVVRAFEERARVNVRVDFVASGTEYEARLRSSPHAWDVVVADEQHLASLYFAKSTRPIPATVPKPSPEAPLARPGRYVPEGERIFVPLAADPLGLAWIGPTRTAPDPVTWDWLADPKANPMWRSRVALPTDPRLQFLVAAGQAGLTAPFTDVSAAKPAFEWLALARHQARPSERVPASLDPESMLLSGRASAAVLWRSQYERVRKLLPELRFAVPDKGTYVERHGAALVAETFHEKEAVAFLTHLQENRDTLARATGLLPLQPSPGQAWAAQSWRVAAEVLPVVKGIEIALEKMR